jgi:hypothetical protein
MWANIVERGRLEMMMMMMMIRRMRIECWVPKATNTHTPTVELIAFPLHQWLHEHASMLRHTYIACRVLCKVYLFEPA